MALFIAEHIWVGGAEEGRISSERALARGACRRDIER